MAKNREFPGEYQSGSSWHETNIPLDSRLFSALPQKRTNSADMDDGFLYHKTSAEFSLTENQAERRKEII